MNNKQLLAWIVVAIVVVIGGWWVLRAPSNTSAIKIGAVFPFTGSSGITGESSKNGLQLAVDELNTQGGIQGKNVEIVYEDSQTKTDVGLSAYKKIQDIDNTNIVFTSVSGVALAIAPLANANKVIQMDVVSASPSYSTPNDYTFRTGVNSYAFAGKMSELLKAKNLNNVALLYVNTEFGVGYRDAFAKDFASAGGTIIITESYNQGDADFRTQLSKIKNSGSDALVLIALQKESPIILTEVGQLKLTIPIYTDVYAAELPDNLKIASAAGVIYIKPDISGNTQFDAFKKSYVDKYAKEPDFIAAQAYDGFRLVAQALKACNGAGDTDCLKNELYRIKDFDGVIGNKISFDGNGDILNRALQVMTIRDGQFMRLSE